MSMSRQFANIGLPPKQRKKQAQKVTAVTTVTRQVQAQAPRANVQVARQIPRGFVTALAADSKFFDTAFASYAINTTGSITHLDIVTQGDSVNQRQGKSWQNTNLQIRGMLSQDTTAVANHIAIYIVWDRQPNKAAFTVTDVLDTAHSASFMKRENKGRFLIVKKWQRVLIGNATTPATGREAIVIDKWIRLPAECIPQCTAADQTGAIGNRITGALMVLMIGNNAPGTADSTFGGGFRLGFRDTP